MQTTVGHDLELPLPVGVLALEVRKRPLWREGSGERGGAEEDGRFGAVAQRRAGEVRLVDADAAEQEHLRSTRTRKDDVEVAVVRVGDVERDEQVLGGP